MEKRLAVIPNDEGPRLKCGPRPRLQRDGFGSHCTDTWLCPPPATSPEPELHPSGKAAAHPGNMRMCFKHFPEALARSPSKDTPSAASHWRTWGSSGDEPRTVLVPSEQSWRRVSSLPASLTKGLGTAEQEVEGQTVPWKRLRGEGSAQGNRTPAEPKAIPATSPKLPFGPASSCLLLLWGACRVQDKRPSASMILRPQEPSCLPDA